MKMTPEQINIVQGAIHVGMENNESRRRQKSERQIDWDNVEQRFFSLLLRYNVCIKLQSGDQDYWCALT